MILELIARHQLQEVLSLASLPTLARLQQERHMDSFYWNSRKAFLSLLDSFLITSVTHETQEYTFRETDLRPLHIVLPLCFIASNRSFNSIQAKPTHLQSYQHYA